MHLALEVWLIIAGLIGSYVLWELRATTITLGIAALLLVFALGWPVMVWLCLATGLQSDDY